MKIVGVQLAALARNTFFGLVFSASFAAAQPCAVPAPQITASGSNLVTQSGYTSYQWYKDGMAINGATGTTLSNPEPGEYTVRAALRSAAFAFVTTARDEAKTASPFSLFPNPSDGLMTLQNAGSPEEAEVFVVALNGQVVKHLRLEAAQSQTLNFQDLSKGLYQVHVRSQSGTLMRRIQIQ